MATRATTCHEGRSLASAVDELEGGAPAGADADGEGGRAAEGIDGDGKRLAVHLADILDALAGPAVDVGEDSALGLEVVGAGEETGFAALDPALVEASNARLEGRSVHSLTSWSSGIAGAGDMGEGPGADCARPLSRGNMGG